MIKNIVFDIGRVLLNYEPMEHIKGLIENEASQAGVHDIIFKSDEWVALDRGIISEAEALAIWSSRAPHLRNEIEKAMEDWCSILTPIEETVKILESLKLKGYKIYLLSNFHKKAFEIVSEKNSFFKLADGMVISYRINKVKPNEDIYNHLLNEYDLCPEETVFIDDTEINVKAAQALNIMGLIFTSPEKLKEDLTSLGCI